MLPLVAVSIVGYLALAAVLVAWWFRIPVIGTLGVFGFVALLVIIAAIAVYRRFHNPTLEASDKALAKERKDGDSDKGTA